MKWCRYQSGWTMNLNWNLGLVGSILTLFAIVFFCESENYSVAKVDATICWTRQPLWTKGKKEEANTNPKLLMLKLFYNIEFKVQYALWTNQSKLGNELCFSYTQEMFNQIGLISRNMTFMKQNYEQTITITAWKCKYESVKWRCVRARDTSYFLFSLHNVEM